MLLEILLAISATAIGSNLYNRRVNKSKEDSLIYDLNEQHKLEIEEVQKADKVKYAKSLKRSKEVRLGLGSENLVAYHPDFPYDAGDVRPLGSPIDGVIFKGSILEDVEEIVFLEVKTGNSRLSKKQRQIRDLVKKGKVKWLEFRIDTKPVKLEHKEDLLEGDECVCATCIA